MLCGVSKVTHIDSAEGEYSSENRFNCARCPPVDATKRIFSPGRATKPSWEISVDLGPECIFPSRVSAIRLGSRVFSPVMSYYRVLQGDHSLASWSVAEVTLDGHALPSSNVRQIEQSGFSNRTIDARRPHLFLECNVQLVSHYARL